MHAAWNFLSKKSLPSAAFFCISTAVGSLALSWIVPLWGIPEKLFSGTFILLALASTGAECLYFIGLANAYRTADISLAYPVARALPVVMIAAISPFLRQDSTLTTGGTIGLLTVCSGCILMPLGTFSDFRIKNYANIAMGFIILAAIGTTGYTLIDAHTMKLVIDAYGGGPAGLMKAALLLTCLIDAGIAAGLGIYVLSFRSERIKIAELFSSPGKLAYPLSSGIMCAIAYILILASMPHVTQLSYLQAFRQMNLPIGVLLGIVFLHEPAHRPKLAGTALIVAGLILIALQS